MPKRVPLLEASPRYELYAEWLLQEHEYEIPADHLQIAVQRYHDFQSSDMNQEANAARIAANAEKKAPAKATKAKATKATKASKAKASKATEADDADDEDESDEAEPAPAKAPAKRAARPATKATRGKAAF
jgi:hypothetical protein